MVVLEWREMFLKTYLIFIYYFNFFVTVVYCVPRVHTSTLWLFIEDLHCVLGNINKEEDTGRKTIIRCLLFNLKQCTHIWISKVQFTLRISAIMPGKKLHLPLAVRSECHQLHRLNSTRNLEKLLEFSYYHTECFQNTKLAVAW